MSITDEIVAVSRTFPARDLTINGINKVNRSPIFGYDRICGTCGKAFLTYPQHVYKHSRNLKGGGKAEYYFCSYTCMRTWEKARDKQKAEERRRHNESTADGL